MLSRIRQRVVLFLSDFVSSRSAGDIDSWEPISSRTPSQRHNKSLSDSALHRASSPDSGRAGSRSSTSLASGSSLGSVSPVSGSSLGSVSPVSDSGLGSASPVSGSSLGNCLSPNSANSSPLKISSYFQEFLNVYNETFFTKVNQSGKMELKFTHKAFIPADYASYALHVQATLTERAKHKFKIAKKIKPLINNIIELFNIVSELENEIGIAFSENLRLDAKRFFEDLGSTLKSIGNKDSVTVVSTPNTPRGDKSPITERSGHFIKSAYLSRFETLFQMIKTDLSNNRPSEDRKAADIKTRKQLFKTFNSFVCRHEPLACDLFFSQNSHNTNFSAEGRLTKDKLVIDVGACLVAGELESADLPVSVFASPTHGAFFVRNNRTFAAHSSAGVFPKRLVPVLPTTEESDRPALLNGGGVAITDEKQGTVIARVTRTLSL